MRSTLFTSTALLITALASPATMAIEEPAYRVVERDGSYELRDYSAYLLAETRVEAPFLDAGNIAFNRLFRYISGNNAARQEIAMTAPVTQAPANAARGRGEKIAMTAPVNQVADGDAFLVGFVVPRKYTRATVPQPLDPAVSIREVPAQLTASWRYSGRWTESNFQAALAELRAVLQTRGLAVAGEPVIARYNPPFMPTFLRRNEVLVPVRRAATAPGE
jgi:SOUL heme-binding protein